MTAKTLTEQIAQAGRNLYFHNNSEKWHEHYNQPRLRKEALKDQKKLLDHIIKKSNARLKQIEKELKK